MRCDGSESAPADLDEQDKGDADLNGALDEHVESAEDERRREDTSDDQRDDEPRECAITEEASHTGDDGRAGRGRSRMR